MIVIRKHVEMSMEGVSVLWRLDLHHHDEEDACFNQSWMLSSWVDALNVANGLVAQQEERFIQLAAEGWRTYEQWDYALDAFAPFTGMSWLCYPCSEAHGEARRTPSPVQHLSWHKKVLARGREEAYRSDMAELETRRAEDAQRSELDQTPKDYEQRIALLEAEKVELSATIAQLRSTLSIMRWG
jgi:hypothetical protein